MKKFIIHFTCVNMMTGQVSEDKNGNERVFTEIVKAKDIKGAKIALWEIIPYILDITKVEEL